MSCENERRSYAFLPRSKANLLVFIAGVQTSTQLPSSEVATVCKFHLKEKPSLNRPVTITMAPRTLPLQIMAFLACLLFFIATAFSVDTTKDQDEMKRARDLAKPWYIQNFQVGDYQFWVSPTTLVIGFLSLYFLISQWSGTPAFCEASHILLMDHTEEAKNTLEDYKSKINNDANLFAKYAKKYSACPSKNQGGNLGKFKQGAMAPPFDKACFSPISKVGETLGPIQTQFGWHLIYIQSRQLPDELS